MEEMGSALGLALHRAGIARRPNAFGSRGADPDRLTETIAERTLSVMMLDWTQCPAVERVQGKVSGAWVFQGTRVPVKALFENLENGARVDEFLQWFPGVTRAQIEAVLEHAGASLAEV